MASLARVYFFSAKIDPETAKRVLSPLARLFKTGDQASTAFRVFASHHVEDLRLICAVSFIVVVWLLTFTLLCTIDRAYLDAVSHPNLEGLHLYSHVALAALGSFLKFFTPVLGVFGAILAWAYQSASARLGVVDLFACEISTLSRVEAVVDRVCRRIDEFTKGPCSDGTCSTNNGMPDHQFSSQENYFPVFEGCARDLQALEARVVINITAFYTYMKSVRDSMRALAQTRPDASESHPHPITVPATHPWHKATCNVVYMLYLALESARNAIADLVEFEPEKAERTVVILISELAAYRFLRCQFADPNELHHRRLMLREPEYRALLPALQTEVTNYGRLPGRIDAAVGQRNPALQRNPPSSGIQLADDATVRLLWEPAIQALPELEKRETVCLPQRAAGLSCEDRSNLCPADGALEDGYRAASGRRRLVRSRVGSRAMSRHWGVDCACPLSVIRQVPEKRFQRIRCATEFCTRKPLIPRRSNFVATRTLCATTTEP